MNRFFVVFLLFVSCHGINDINVPDVEDTEFCLGAEQNIERLQCMDRAGNPMWINLHGERFSETCRVVQDEGGIFLNPRCVMEAETCEEVNECPTM